MSDQVIWVHGTSGHVQVVEKDWGEFTPFGAGVYLEGKVQGPKNEDEPWVHFHIPLTSAAVEGAQQWPRLKEIMLQFTTDYDPPDTDPDWVKESHGYFRYMTDEGGAYISRIHVYDGNGRIFAKDGLDWTSPQWDVYVEESLPLPKEPEIKYGLGVSVRVRYKNQMYVKRLEAPEGNTNHYGIDDGDYEPQVVKATRSDEKRAVISGVGCKIVPAAP